MRHNCGLQLWSTVINCGLLLAKMANKLASLANEALYPDWDTLSILSCIQLRKLFDNIRNSTSTGCTKTRRRNFAQKRLGKIYKVEYLQFLSVNFKILRSKVSKFILLFEVSFIASPFLTIFPLFNLNVKVQKRIPNRIHLIEIVSRRGYVSQTGYVSQSGNSAPLMMV